MQPLLSVLVLSVTLRGGRGGRMRDSYVEDLGLNSVSTLRSLCMILVSSKFIHDCSGSHPSVGT